MLVKALAVELFCLVLCASIDVDLARRNFFMIDVIGGLQLPIFCVSACFKFKSSDFIEANQK